MNEQLEEYLKNIVESSTQKAAIEEWKIASGNQKTPLYNYRLDHVQEVVELAKYLATGREAKMDVIILSAWLHDLAKPRVGGISAEHHGVRSAELAEDILSRKGIDSETIRQIADVIQKHVGLTIKEPLEPIEAQILWEADKLLKLGVIGLFQQILNGIRLFPGESLEEIANRLRDFLPLAEKIAACVSTERGKCIAAERLQRLYTISEMLDSEVHIGKQ
jgi:uncharacterized protein